MITTGIRKVCASFSPSEPGRFRYDPAPLPILIGQVEILPVLFGKLLVPPAVIREMRHAKAPPAVAAWARELPAWVEVKAPVTDLFLDIGAGEDEAISLAVELGYAALLVDDRKARTAAMKRGVVTFGTIALLDLADEVGFLEFPAAVARLQTTTFHIEMEFIESIAAKVRARKNP